MSEKQKQQLAKIWQEAQVWGTRVLLAWNIWFLSEIYADFKQTKKDLELIKQQLASMVSVVDILKDFYLKEK